MKYASADILDLLRDELQQQLGPRYIVAIDHTQPPDFPDESATLAMFSIKYAGQEKFLCTVFTNEAETDILKGSPQLVSWGLNASLESMEIFRSKQRH